VTADRLELRTGGLYSIAWGDGNYGAVKVLRVDNVGVHVRLFSDEWPARPKNLASTELKIRSTLEEGMPGLGHLPTTRAVFDLWRPEFVAVEAVAESELEGFYQWQEANGGYFDENLAATPRKVQQSVWEIIRKGRDEGSWQEAD